MCVNLQGSRQTPSMDAMLHGRKSGRYPAQLTWNGPRRANHSTRISYHQNFAYTQTHTKHAKSSQVIAYGYLLHLVSVSTTGMRMQRVGYLDNYLSKLNGVPKVFRIILINLTKYLDSGRVPRSTPEVWTTWDGVS